MPNFSAVSIETLMWLALAGLLLALIGNLWLLVTAAQRAVGWFFAVLIIPFAGVALACVDARSRRPLVLALLGLGLFFAAAIKGESEKTKQLSYQKRVESFFTAAYDKVTGKNLSDRQARVRKWQLELERKKAALNPYDLAAQAAFHQELNEYLLELQKVKSEMAAAGR